MRKTIYLTDENIIKLRDALKEKLKEHKDHKSLGKSHQNGYEGMANFICEQLKVKIAGDSKYREVKDQIGRFVTYHILWKIIYENVHFPEKRTRMTRMTIDLLTLFAFGEVTEDRMQEIPEQKRPKGSIKQTYQALTELGFAYYDEISFKKLNRLISQAQEEIRIIDTFLDNWRKIRKDLKKAVEQGCKVSILLNEPDFQAIVKRSFRISDIGGGIESLRKSINNIRAEVETWENSNLVKIETHDSLPGFNLFAVDNDYFIGLFWHDREAIDGPFMKVTNQGFKKYVDEHFEAMWEYAVKPKSQRVIAIGKPLDTRLSPYLGTWNLYCNKVEKNEESYNLRSMEHGKVVENLIRFEEKSGVVEATFVSSDGRVFEGEAFICRNNDSFLEVQLKSVVNNNNIQFYFHIGAGLYNNLIGIYSHLYVNAPILGAGLSVIVRSKENHSISIENWEPRPIDKIDEMERKKTLRYLTFPAGSRLEAIQSFEQLKTYNRFNYPSLAEGVYKIYSYQGSEDNPFNRYITESLLYIDEFYQVFHKRCGLAYANDKKYAESRGKVESSKSDSLIISLKSLEHGRIGFFVINFVEERPKLGDYFTGVFSGVGLRNRKVAIGNRVVLRFLGKNKELFDNTEIDRYRINSERFFEIPKEVRRNLTGRTNNMVGFLHTKGASSSKALLNEADKGIDMKSVLFDSALQRALTDNVNQIPNSVKAFERALLHGFEPFEAYENKLAEYEKIGLISSHMRKGIFGNEAFRSLRKKFEKKK